MSEILLVRHGIPACDDRTPVRGTEFARWVEEYDRAPLDPASTPPPLLQRRASEMSCVVTSTLRRSIESARLLIGRQPVWTESLFDEVAIPTAIRVNVTLRPGHWGALMRVMWFAGMPSDGESLAEASSRAERAAARLKELAAEHCGAMLVGHGMLNTLVGRALRRAGWRGTGPLRRHWGSCALREPAGRSGRSAPDRRVHPEGR